MSIAGTLVIIGVIWGRHSESVKSQNAKNIEQDKKITALNLLVTAREDIMRGHIDAKFKSLDDKLGEINTHLLNISRAGDCK